MVGIVVSLLMTLLPVVVYQLIMVKMGRTLTNTHRNCTYVLVLYVWAVLFVTGVGSVYDFIEKGGWAASVQQATFCLLPFQEGFLLTALLNVALFVPLGFGLPHVWLNFRSGLKTTLVGCGLSLMVEFAQIPTNRTVDIEDVLMNTLGTFLGYMFWKTIGNYVFQGHVSRRITELSNSEPLIYIMMVFICQFFFYNWRWFV